MPLPFSKATVRCWTTEALNKNDHQGHFLNTSLIMWSKPNGLSGLIPPSLSFYNICFLTPAIIHKCNGTIDLPTEQDDTVRVIWAYSNTDPASEMNLQYHHKRGTKSIYLRSPQFQMPLLDPDVKSWDFLSPNVCKQLIHGTYEYIFATFNC